MARIFKFNGFPDGTSEIEKKQRCEGEFTVGNDYTALDIDEAPNKDAIFKDNICRNVRCELSLFTEV